MKKNNRSLLKKRADRLRDVLKRHPSLSADDIIDHALLLSEWAFDLGRNEVLQEEMEKAQRRQEEGDVSQ